MNRDFQKGGEGLREYPLWCKILYTTASSTVHIAHCTTVAVPTASVVEPEPSFFAGAGKKGAAPAPAQTCDKKK